jgi:hypothetical protein
VLGDAAILWQDARLRLRWVEDNHVAEELSRLLGGPELFDAVRDATIALGETLGVGTKPREVPSRSALVNARKAFVRAVAAYARALSVRVDEESPASIQQFLDAVAPLDEYRTTRAAVAEPLEDEDEVVVLPAEPVP